MALWPAPSLRRYPPLRGTLTADVAVIGGGITGAIVAQMFSAAKIGVVVIEAERIAGGSTTASTALLMQEPDRDLAELTRRYGKKSAVDVWRALSGATAGLAAVLRRSQIDCDLRKARSIYFTFDPRKVPNLREEIRRRRAAGLPGRWLSAEQLMRDTGIAGHAAIATSGNFEADPVKACTGLMRAAIRGGARVFERTRVKRIIRTQDGVTITTRGGTVHAKCAIVATGYATAEFKPLAGRFRMRDTFVIATRRVPATMRRKLIGKRQMLWDTDRPYHYVRWSPDGRLIVGGEDRPHKGMSRDRRRAQLRTAEARLRTYLARLYPELGTIAIEHAWEGLFAETEDGLPFIGPHRRYPGQLFALGYGGNGMTASFLAAKFLLARYRKRPDPRERLFAFNR